MKRRRSLGVDQHGDPVWPEGTGFAVGAAGGDRAAHFDDYGDAAGFLAELRTAGCDAVCEVSCGLHTDLIGGPTFRDRAEATGAAVLLWETVLEGAVVVGD